jgi:glycosyltransferase involved in cell wall biosynthesis
MSGGGQPRVPGTRAAKPKILYLITEDWFFCRHFLPMARAARGVGFEVVVATRVRRHAEAIAAEGARVIALEGERGSLGPIEILRSMVRMARIIGAERPDVVHCIALRMVLLGGLAARFVGIPTMVLAPTGLGHLWINNGALESLARRASRYVIGRWLKGPRTCYVFENAEDPLEFRLDPSSAHVRLIGGAGVEPAAFPPKPEPLAPPIKVAVVARMVKTKGIAECVAAVVRARALGAHVELHLFGEPDRSNRMSLSETDLRGWAAEPGIYWHGPTAEPARVWCEHHVAMLLSHREGLPKSLIEAAASGRPIIASDVTGCREVVRNGIEGFLVPLGDVEATAQALVQIAENPALRGRMGAAAHARFKAKFTVEAVMATMDGLYRRLYHPPS